MFIAGVRRKHEIMQAKAAFDPKPTFRVFSRFLNRYAAGLVQKSLLDNPQIIQF